MTKSVFISSTSKDLREHRAAVKDAILRLRMRPIDMADFGSQPGGAVGVSVSEVRRADYFVGIIAHRYGYVPDGMEKSVTEQEYDEAVKRNIPRLMYLVKSGHDWEWEGKSAPENIEDAAAQAKLAAFKARINKTEVRSEFATTENLASQITIDLAKFETGSKRRSRRTQILSVAALIIVFAVVALLTNLGGIRSALAKFIELNGIARLHGQPFPQNKVGVVFADFHLIDEGAPRAEPNLEREFRQAGIPFVRVNYLLNNREEAKRLAEAYNAAITIWGEIAEGGVLVQFEVPPEVLIPITELEVTATELEAFEVYIFEGMDSLYVVNFVQGQIAFFEGKYNEAIVALDNAVQLSVDMPINHLNPLKLDGLYFYRGYTHYALKAFEQSVSDYSKSLEFNSNSVPALNNRGLSYTELEKFDLAIEDYEKAISINRNLPNLYNNLGFTYLKMEDYETAIPNLTQAINLKPDYVIALSNRGVAYTHLQPPLYESAIEDLNRAISLDQAYAQAYHNLGEVYRLLERYTEALENFNRAIELDPNSVESSIYMGYCYFMQDNPNYQKAFEVLNYAIDKDPQNAKAYHVRGLANAYSDNVDAAIADFTRALTYDVCSDPQKLDTGLNEVSYVQKGKTHENETKIHSRVQEPGGAASAERGANGRPGVSRA